MPDKKSILPLESDRFYHIFNRGNNFENIFYKPKNYLYFLQKYDFYLSDYIDTYAYCLLPNHFHLLIKTKDSIFLKDRILNNSEEIGKAVSEQFRYFFISYAMSINIQEGRNGSLFLKNFKRILVDNELYLKHLINYIHYNPLKHNITDDYSKYSYSSYKSILSISNTKLKRDDVLNKFFNSKDDFTDFHQYLIDEKEIERYMIED